jgi:hypothetical protein
MSIDIGALGQATCLSGNMGQTNSYYGRVKPRSEIAFNVNEYPI